MSLRDISNNFKQKQQLAWAQLSKKNKDNLTAWEIDHSIHCKKLYNDFDIGFYSEIEENIIIGGDMVAQDPNMLAKLKITSILNMAEEIDYTPLFDDLDVVKIGIGDGEMAPVGVYEEAAKTIHKALEAGKRIYIHCAAGISRSTTAFTTYLILYRDMNFWDAVAYIRSKRPCAAPHPLLVRSVLRDLGDRFKF